MKRTGIHIKLSMLALFLLFSSTIGSTAIGSTAVEATEEKNVFEQTMEHYEVIREGLLVDDDAEVRAEGKAIHEALIALSENFNAEAVGVAAENAEAAQKLLPELIEASKALAEAKDIEAARAALYAFSKPMVRLRKLAVGNLPSVAYCSMHKKSWLQPAGEEIGNPYAGQSMPKCGDIVTQ